MCHKKYRHRGCPVCNNFQPKKLYEQQFASFSGISFLEGYDVVVCSNCGFGYADNIPSQHDFDLYYEQMSKYENRANGGHESSADAKRYQDSAYYINQYIHEKDIDILEIGCSTGALLYELTKLGFKNVYGLDPSPYCSKLAWELYNISVITGTISSFVNKPTYGLIILVGVLEHIENLQEALTTINRLLTVDGLLYLEIPDTSRFNLYPDAPFQQFSIEHINFFSLTSLINLLNKYNFDLLTYRLDEKAQSAMQTMPTISAFFKKQNTNNNRNYFVKDLELGKSLSLYIQQSKIVENKLYQIIENIIDTEKPVVVWGVGTHTRRLLSISSFAKANILAFFDSDPKYIGGLFEGIPVLPPDKLRDYSCPVLVSSRVFQKEIVEQIREQLECNNELILLY